MSMRLVLLFCVLSAFVFGIQTGLSDVPVVGRGKALYSSNPTNSGFTKLIGLDSSGRVVVGSGETTVSMNALTATSFTASSLTATTITVPTASSWAIPTSAATLTTGNVNLLFKIGGVVYRVKANTAD